MTIMKRTFGITTLLILLIHLGGCKTTPPQGVQPIDNFDLARYLGTWYEIARLDHSFERDLEQVTAEYSLRDDGGVKVVNSGVNSKTGKRKTAVGRAYFVGAKNIGLLKVSFFGPFYGAYVIIDLDDDYQHALVSGPNHSYLWILSRSPQIDPSEMQRLLDIAKENGFDTSKLIFVEQNRTSPINSPNTRGTQNQPI